MSIVPAVPYPASGPAALKLMPSTTKEMLSLSTPCQEDQCLTPTFCFCTATHQRISPVRFDRCRTHPISHIDAVAAAAEAQAASQRQGTPAPTPDNGSAAASTPAAAAPPLPPLHWLPATLAAVALRLHALDAALVYRPDSPPARDMLQVRPCLQHSQSACQARSCGSAPACSGCCSGVPPQSKHALRCDSACSIVIQRAMLQIWPGASLCGS